MNDIERIRVTHRLSDHTQTEKDLELLRQRDKETAEKFGVNPRLFADDILFALTKVASEADILSNRHPSEPEKEEEKEPAPEPEKREAKKKPSQKSKSTQK